VENAGASSTETIRVFVSYAREDRGWVDAGCAYQIVPFLADSLRRSSVSFWFDQALHPGDEYKREIDAEIDQSQIALLIVSQHFLNSEFIETREMPRIAARAAEGKMIVIPVLVEPCDWSEYPFLADRQMVPTDPLIEYTESPAKWAKVRAQILDGLKSQAKRIREESGAAVREAEAARMAALKQQREAEELRRKREAEDAARETAKREAEAARRREADQQRRDAEARERLDEAERITRQAETVRKAAEDERIAGVESVHGTGAREAAGAAKTGGSIDNLVGMRRLGVPLIVIAIWACGMALRLVYTAYVFARVAPTPNNLRLEAYAFHALGDHSFWLPFVVLDLILAGLFVAGATLILRRRAFWLRLLPAAMIAQILYMLVLYGNLYVRWGFPGVDWFFLWGGYVPFVEVIVDIAVLVYVVRSWKRLKEALAR